MSRSVFARTTLEDPLVDALQMQKEMDRLFRAVKPWTPPLDVVDAGGALLVRVELPGLRQEEIELSVQGGVLAIRGARRPDPGIARESYHLQERLTGPFQRTLTLPSIVDVTQVTAAYGDGVLEIRLPKKEEARPRAIRVEAA